MSVFTSIAPPELIKDASPEVGVTSALNTVPVNVRPAPAVYVPAPENCVKLIASVPIVAGEFVCTQPVFPYEVPADTNIKSPEDISVAVSKSAARTAAPDD